MEIDIDQIYGNCPVQAEGTINGKPFYFRARGSHWSLSIDSHDPMGDAEWEHLQWYGKWPDAGWMPYEEAEAFLREAAARYDAGLPGGSLKDDPVRMAEAKAEWDKLLEGKRDE